MINVLVVDDSVNDLQIIANALNADKDITTYYCRESKRALELAIEVKPDFILLDVLMPEIDGFELRQKLLENTHTNNMPVIFISADEQIETQIKGYKVGCLQYLTKPINQKKLISLIKRNSIVRRIDSVIQKNQFIRDGLDKCANCLHLKVI